MILFLLWFHCRLCINRNLFKFNFIGASTKVHTQSHGDGRGRHLSAWEHLQSIFFRYFIFLLSQLCTCFNGPHTHLALVLNFRISVRNQFIHRVARSRVCSNFHGRFRDKRCDCMCLWFSMSTWMTHQIDVWIFWKRIKCDQIAIPSPNIIPLNKILFCVIIGQTILRLCVNGNAQLNIIHKKSNLNWSRAIRNGIHDESFIIFIQLLNSNRTHI